MRIHLTFGIILLLTILLARYLHSNCLTTLPDEIGELKNLEQLNVDQNNLTSLSPAVGKLIKLKSISFNGNRIKSIPNGKSKDK